MKKLTMKEINDRAMKEIMGGIGGSNPNPMPPDPTNPPPSY